MEGLIGVLADIVILVAFTFWFFNEKPADDKH